MVHQPAFDIVTGQIGAVGTMTTLAKIIADAINEIDANRYKKSEWASGSGWLKLPTGHLINWGSVTIANKPQGIHISFPRAFTTLYQVYTCNHSGNVSNSNTYSSTGFNYNGNGDNAWIAIGVGV
jgi:hypothetical protein